MSAIKTEPEGYDDLYGDLYGDNDEEVLAASAAAAAAAATSTSTSGDVKPDLASTPSAIPSYSGDTPAPQQQQRQQQEQQQQPAPLHFDANYAARAGDRPLNTRPSDMPEEGKMFIGGLNWDTTDDSLKTYFEQFGRITHSTIMRDAESGRSRGFAFLTFEDAASVNAVLAKDHFLDGKTIDPKRAVPRSEAQKSDKLFVRSIPQSCTPESFKQFWTTWGTVTDATLMMDKETGRHRGFGFVNYSQGEAVEKVLGSAPHFMDGQLLEVKRAQAKGEARRPDYGINTNQNQHAGAGVGPPMGMGMGGGVVNPAFGFPGGQQGGGGGQGQAPFDPVAMSKFFASMGWGAWNPMMMGGMMGAGAGGMGMPGMGMGMPGMGMGMGMGMGGFGMGGMPGMGGFGGQIGQGEGGGGGEGGASPAAPGQQSQWTGPMAQQPMRGGTGGGGGRGGRGGGRGGHFNPPTGPAAMRGPGGASPPPQQGGAGAGAGAGGSTTPNHGAGAGPQRTRGGGAGYHPYSR